MKTKDFNASARLREVVRYLQKKHLEETGQKLFIKDILEKHFRPDMDDSFGRWRKQFKRFTPLILQKLEVLRKEGINTPDYFELPDAPMLVAEEPQVLHKEAVKEVLMETSDRDVLENILKKLEQLTALQKKNNELLQENNRLRRRGKDTV